LQNFTGESSAILVFTDVKHAAIFYFEFCVRTSVFVCEVDLLRLL